MICVSILWEHIHSKTEKKDLRIFYSITEKGYVLNCRKRIASLKDFSGFFQLFVAKYIGTNSHVMKHGKVCLMKTVGNVFLWLSTMQ